MQLPSSSGSQKLIQGKLKENEPFLMQPNRQARLQEIAERLAALEASPLYDYRVTNDYKPVFGEGSPTAEILLIGEAPGEWEAKSGRPFVGASGRLLDQLLNSIDLRRADVYITNVVKDRPPENRAPTSGEIALYSPLLVEQIEIIQPKVIATLGRFAMDFIFDLFQMAEKGRKISQMHGQVLHARAAYGELIVVPLYHPAVALYTTAQRETLAADFQVLKQFGQQNVSP
jgi:uracil-DNA glycosylase